MKEGTIRLNNNEEIYYYECNTKHLGKEPSLVFVHGNTSSSEAWRDTIEHIQNIKRHIVALDLRGFGRSTYKQPCNRYVHWAEDIK
jgi:pimeloyl-ACP methyl ester carboxylesterase